jgi:hypothetical protein
MKCFILQIMTRVEALVKAGYSCGGGTDTTPLLIDLGFFSTSLRTVLLPGVDEHVPGRLFLPFLFPYLKSCSSKNIRPLIAYVGE